MSMAASIVTYTIDAANAEEIRTRVRDHLIPAARGTKGYRGFLLLDQGEGERMAILLYDSAEDVRAAQATLTPVGRDHTYPLMTGPAIGSLGMVVLSDGVFADGSTS